MDFLSVLSGPGCKVCSVFKRWTTKQKKCVACHKNLKEEEAGQPSNERVDNDCPLNTQELGEATWKLLHTMAAYYPDNPTETQRCEMAHFFEILAKYYPCSLCAKDFQDDLKSMPPQTESAEQLSQWLCRLHNKVNEKVGKPLFDCSRVNERWRDGWKDGSCE